MLSQEEMRKSGSRFTSKEIEALFAVGDINGDGELDINEFINVICPGATTVISRLRNVFNSDKILSHISPFNSDKIIFLIALTN